MPAHRVYVEPFGGAASVLLRKPRAYAEVYNDLDGEVCNVFRVLRDPPAAARLAEQLHLTPFAREEFKDSYQPTDDAVERARRTMVRSFMGFGTTTLRESRTGFRGNGIRVGQPPQIDWALFPPQVELFVERLRGVVIENREASDLIAQQDRPETLFYVDPPYVHETRSALTRGSHRGTAYRHELTDADHAALAEQLHGCAGMALVSGYPCDLYERLYRGWQRVERPHHADGARDRIEVLWINPACSEALAQGAAQQELIA